MGCDIHPHVEIKIEGRWEHYGCPHIARNYDLFSKMAGVRQESDSPKPISEPRGLPSDVSMVTRLDADHWGPDAHSASWLSAEEAGEVQEWIEKLDENKSWHPPLFGYLFGNYIHSHVKYPEDCENIRKLGFEDARLVFWFDN